MLDDETAPRVMDHHGTSSNLGSRAIATPYLGMEAAYWRAKTYTARRDNKTRNRGYKTLYMFTDDSRDSYIPILDEDRSLARESMGLAKALSDSSSCHEEYRTRRGKKKKEDVSHNIIHHHKSQNIEVLLCYGK